MDVMNSGCERNHTSSLQSDRDVMSRVLEKFARQFRIRWMVKNVWGGVKNQVVIAGMQYPDFDLRSSALEHITACVASRIPLWLDPPAGRLDLRLSTVPADPDRLCVRWRYRQRQHRHAPGQAAPGRGQNR